MNLNSLTSDGMPFAMRDSTADDWNRGGVYLVFISFFRYADLKPCFRCATIT